MGRPQATWQTETSLWPKKKKAKTIFAIVAREMGAAWTGEKGVVAEQHKQEQ